MPKSKEFLTSSDSDSGADEPKQKKKKTESKPAKEESSNSKDDGSKSKAKKAPGGEIMFELSRMRYATVGEFRGKVFVGIREYYEKDGELRPGKKGISLNPEQWKALKSHIDDIDEACKDL